MLSCVFAESGWLDAYNCCVLCLDLIGKDVRQIWDILTKKDNSFRDGRLAPTFLYRIYDFLGSKDSKYIFEVLTNSGCYLLGTVGESTIFFKANFLGPDDIS